MLSGLKMGLGRRAHLGMSFVCASCKQRFHSSQELLNHRNSSYCTGDERYGCPHCNMDFKNRNVLKVHMQIHFEELTPPPPMPKKVIPPRPNTRISPYKKIGFTKIRLEDCLRCDECSCVYMYESDYLKHMRNFHKTKNNSSKTKKQQQEKKNNNKSCRSCCRQCNCTEGHTSAVVSLPTPPIIAETPPQPNNLLNFSIKDRWSKVVSRHLSDINEPDKNDEAEIDEGIDLSHLLSQVEVKIKTEPNDIFENELGAFDFPVPLSAIKTEPIEN